MPSRRAPGAFRLNKAIFRDLAVLDGVADECMAVAKEGAKSARRLASRTKDTGDYQESIVAEAHESKLSGSNLKRRGARFGSSDPAGLRQEFGSSRTDEKAHRHLGRAAEQLGHGA